MIYQMALSGMGEPLGRYLSQISSKYSAQFNLWLKQISQLSLNLQVMVILNGHGLEIL